MRAAPFSQSPDETAPENTGATWVVDRTAQLARACLMPDWKLLLRGWRVAAKLAMTSLLARNKPTTLSESHVRDVRRTRAEVEAERCKAFWWA
jgi:hypothetical protein